MLLLLLGIGAVASGLLPLDQAAATTGRVLPLLVFLGAVVLLAELTAAAEVFETIAARLAILAAGRVWLLFLLCVAFAATTTIVLNLDTTAVLLTPVMLSLTRKLGTPGVMLAMTTVWLANTASLLLPVSNLTNLLAMNRIRLSPVGFAADMGLPELGSVAVTAICLWVFYWRSGGKRFIVPQPHVPADRVLYTIALTACVLFTVGVVLGVQLALVAVVCAGVLLLGFARRAPEILSWRLLPWRLLVLVTGLFLVVGTVSARGFGTVVRALIGTNAGAAGVVRAVAFGFGSANLLNNLPTYLAGEAATPLANHQQLFGLLLGTNIGPLVTPWASLATLLWFERCRSAGVTIDWRRFIATGAVTAICALTVATAALLV